MTIETGALEQGYAKVETAYGVQPADTLAGSDGIRILNLSLTSKKNRERSPQKRGTPDYAQSLPRRQSQNFTTGDMMWEPSGTLGTISNLGKFIKAGMGSANAITGGLSTTVAASPSPTTTGCSLNAVTGLAVDDIIVFTYADLHREATRVKTVAVDTTAVPVAPSGALAGAGAGNVENGTHSYRVVNVIAGTDSQASAASATVTVVDKTSDGKVDLTGIAVGPTGTTARKVYRTAAGNAVTGPWKLLTTIADNTTTTFTDNVADASLTTTLTTTYAITYDTVSAAPPAAGAAVAGISFKLTNRVTESLALYKYYNGGGFKQACYGCVVDQIDVTFDGTKEVMIGFQGPAGRYADSTSGTVQSKPATHVTVGSPAAGMVGGFYVDGVAFPVISAKLSAQNQLALRNKELGTAFASGIGGRNATRQNKIDITFYMEDTTLFTKANGVTRGLLTCLVGDTNGQMVAMVCPSVEFEIPDVPTGVGLHEITISGECYATSGNDAFMLAEI